jgi:hypothetical protein
MSSLVNPPRPDSTHPARRPRPTSNTHFLLCPQRALNAVAAPSHPLIPTSAPSRPRRSAASRPRHSVHKVAPGRFLRLSSSTSLSVPPSISLLASPLPKVSRGISSSRSHLRFAPLPGRHRAWSHRQELHRLPKAGFSPTRVPPSISVTVSSQRHRPRAHC